MASWAFRTMIVPAALAPTCRALAASSPSGAGMWTTGLSASGNAPATHFVSSGLIWQQFADMLASPSALAAGAGIPLAQAQSILSACDVSQEPGLTAVARLGLKLVTE